MKIRDTKFEQINVTPELKELVELFCKRIEKLDENRLNKIRGPEESTDDDSCERFDELFDVDLDQHLVKNFTDGEVISLEDRYKKIAEKEQHPVAKEAYLFAVKTLNLRTKYFGGLNAGDLTVINELDTASLSTDTLKFILGEDVGVPSCEWWGTNSPVFGELIETIGFGEAELIFDIWFRWSDEPRFLNEELRLILEAREALG